MAQKTYPELKILPMDTCMKLNKAACPKPAVGDCRFDWLKACNHIC